jgi:hypothetical protein
MPLDQWQPLTHGGLSLSIPTSLSTDAMQSFQTSTSGIDQFTDTPIAATAAPRKADSDVSGRSAGTFC